MHPPFVGEGGAPDERLMEPMAEICHFGHVAGEFRDLFYLPGRQDFVPHFKFEVGDDGAKVRVSASLPVPVDG
jgi:hypothetical protein